MRTTWTAFAGKQTGDQIWLVVCSDEKPDELVCGVVGKMTPAVRRFSTPNGIEGRVEYRSSWWRPRDTRAVWRDGQERLYAKVATSADIERLTDPNRAKREALEEVLRDARWYGKDEHLPALIASLEKSLQAAKELHDAL